MTFKTQIKMYVGFVIGLIVLVVGIKVMGVDTVQGNEAYVRQHWKKGVVDEVYRDGTHFYNGWLWDTHRYNIGTQKVTFDNKQSNADAEYARIIVNVGENGGQEAYIAISANYRIGWELTDAGPKFSPKKLVALHKDGIGRNYESVILKRTIVDVVNQIARPQQALSIYSGKGFVEFKEAIDTALKNHPVFAERGILIENTIVYKVYLDPKYEAEIAAKQQAIQAKLRKVEETKAAEEEARRQFALSQADVEKRTQAAEAKKIERIKSAEAEKQEQVLMAEGKRDSDLAKAAGVLAIGEAEAKVAELKRDAMYNGESGKRRAAVEIETAKARIYKGMLHGTKVITDKSIVQLSNTAGVSDVKMTLPLE